MKRCLFVFVVIALLFNIIWENLHATLYSPNDWMSDSYYLLCTIGDVVIILIMYVCVGKIFNDLNWAKKLTLSQLAVMLIIGALAALIVEMVALYLNWWQYTENMPIVPLIGIGLSPFLQLALTSVASVVITSRILQIASK